MQRNTSKKPPFRPIHALAAAVLAAGALSVSAPAFAAPNGHASAASTSGVILIGDRDGNDNRWSGKDRDLRYKMKKGDDRADRDDDRWDRNRRDDRGRAQGRLEGRLEGRHDNGNHYGWERGRHYGWDKNGGSRGYEGRRTGEGSDWRAERRYSRWTGQHIGRVDSSVMRDYDAYDLPRPGPGQYYARSGNDVYLVTERTQRIMDAFMLRGLVR